MTPHKHNHSHHHQSTKNLRFVFFLNLSFTIIELIGGLLTNSVAILSDAVHDLGDSLSLGLAWYFQKLSKKKQDQRFSYGYKRFSVLGAIINSVVLLLGSIFILSEAIPRLLNPQEAHVGGMFLLALLGVGVNGIAVFRLKQGKGLNEKVARLHLLEDVLGWLAVLVGSVLMYFFDWPFIDPLLSILISGFVCYNVFKNLWKALKIVMQSIPEEVDLSLIEQKLEKLPQINRIHHLHAWTLDGTNHILTAHIIPDQNYSLNELGLLKEKIKQHFRDLYIQHVTLEFESEGQACELEANPTVH